MKTAKEWADEFRHNLRLVLARDPILMTGKSLIETMVEEVQKDALKSAFKESELSKSKAVEDFISRLDREGKAE